MEKKQRNLALGIVALVLAATLAFWLARPAPDEPGEASGVADPIGVSTLTLFSGDQVRAAKDELLLAFRSNATDADIEATLAPLRAQGFAVIGQVPEFRLYQLRVPDDMVALAMLDASDDPAVLGAFPNLLVSLDQDPAWNAAINRPLPEEYPSDCGGATIGIIDMGQHGEHVSAIVDHLAPNVAQDAHLEGADTADRLAAFGQEEEGIFATMAYAYQAAAQILADGAGQDLVLQMSLGTGISRQADGSLQVGDRTLTDAEATRARQIFREYANPMVERLQFGDALLTLSGGNDGIFDTGALPSSSWREYTVNVGGVTLLGAGTDGVYGTLDDQLDIADFSRRGSNIDLYAPAEGIVVPNGRYGQDTARGTSFAAPQVAAAAALVRCENPDLDARTVKQVLLDSANRITTPSGQTIPVLNMRAANQAAREIREGITILIDPRLHHLGDNHYTGSINSQFESGAESNQYTMTFEVTRTQTQLSTPTLRILAKGGEDANAILVNGQLVGSLCCSPVDGAYGIVQVSLPGDLLTEGTNNIVILSDLDEEDDYDDFEFMGVLLRFFPPTPP